MSITSAALLPSAPTAITIRPDPSASSAQAGQSSGDASFSFGDLLDVINPLQHIPIISTIYQKLTGDIPSPGANILGGLLFGGPIGLAAAVANEVVNQSTGKDIAGNVLSALSGSSDTQDANTLTSDTSRPRDHEGYSLAASVAPATASAAYNNAQKAVLSIFEPEALSTL